MNRRALLLAVAALLAGCGGTREAQTNAAPPEASAAMPHDSLPLRRLSAEVEAGYRHNSRMESAARELVRDAAAWSRLWPRLSGSMGGASPAPQVDFAREMALVAAMGQRNTGGYEIRIESVERTGDGLVA
ncbi:MAG TPA: protease complex subunit PrcB family protein, partial [Longimicrobium sp.]|nr:protease complex subunit PrcB family protein [Longimicrobium sp.]